MVRLDERGQRKDSSSDNSSVYKRRQADGSSVKTNYLHSSSVQTSDELACVVRLDISICVYKTDNL